MPDQEDNKPTALSPEGVLMLFIAVIFDFIGLILLVLTLFWGIGQAISPFLDIAGLVVIGGWMMARAGTITVPKKALKTAGKLGKKIGLPFLGELIPVFGDIAFCWTLAVWFSLK